MFLHQEHVPSYLRVKEPRSQRSNFRLVPERELGYSGPIEIQFRAIWTQPLRQSCDLDQIRWEDNYFAPNCLLGDDLNSNIWKIIWDLILSFLIQQPENQRENKNNFSKEVRGSLSLWLASWPFWAIFDYLLAILHSLFIKFSWETLRRSYDVSDYIKEEEMHNWDPFFFSFLSLIYV